MSYWQNTNTKALKPGRSDGSHRKGRLGRKLIVQILILNALLSLAASSVQLYVGYQRDKAQVLNSVSVIETSFRTGFEGALWEYNFALVEALLDGAYSKPEVEFLFLEADQGRSWTLGDTGTQETRIETLTFHHLDDAGKVHRVGSLDIGLTFENIKARAWSDVWTLLLSNFAKTICASLLMLLLFERNVGRHLSAIASRVTRASVSGSNDPITLDRAPNTEPDDLDHIISSINAATTRSLNTFVALKREVEQRKLVQDALQDRTEALENANREQAQFTYAISHDLKSPANTINMLLQELETHEATGLTEDGKEMLGDAQRTVRRMARLVEDILGYARTIEDAMKVEPVDLNNLAHEVAEDLRGDIQAADATLLISDLPVVEGNAAQLRMLLQNLISNAVKFRAPDRAPVVEVKSGSSGANNTVQIIVADNGIGIASEYHGKVFELFQRLHSFQEFAGSGLGLTLCKRIVTNHMGRISLTSEDGQGTTIEITLPRERHGT